MGFFSSPLFLGIVAVIALLYGLPVVIGAWKLSKLTFFCDPLERQPANAVPEYVHEYFTDAITALESHQFKRVGYYTLEAVQGHLEWLVLLQNSQQTRAFVSTVTQSEQTSSVSVILSTFFADQGLLETINQMDPGFFPSQMRFWQQFVSPVDVDELLQIHQQKLIELSKSETILTLTADQFLEQGKTHSIQRAEYFKQLGQIFWVNPQVSYRLSWRKIGMLIVGEFRKRWFTKPSAPKKTLNTKGSDAVPSVSLKSQAERDFVEFQRQQQQANPMSRRTRSWLFLGTLTFFLVVYASVFDLQGLLIFVAALLLHEGGHVLAMKIFGYRDAAMLFIPFLGALATARKEDATLTEKVWISLAGPLPGLALGIGLAISLRLSGMAPVSWGEEAVSILVFLNLFNLLPIYPLDGGQVADLLLFSRNPQIGVVFKAIGTGMLILTGLLLGAPLLFAFAILISLSIPHSFRLAKLSNQLRREFHSTPETSLTTEDTDALARQVFQRLQQPPHDTLTFAQKSTLLTGILNSRKEEAASWTTRVGLSSVYLVSLLVGLIGGIAAIISTPTAIEATETELADDIELATLSARATTPHVCQADIALQAATVNENAAVMSDRQITLIGTLDTPEQAQAVWQTLQPQLNPNDSASLFGQTIFVSTFNTQTQEQVSAALDAAAATVLTEDLFAGRGTVVRMTAEAPNEQQATQVTEELSSFFTVAENFTHSEDAVSIGPLRAPWDPPTTEHPPEELVQQANARYTYAQLITAQEDTYLQSLSPNFSWVKGIVGSMIGHDGWATSADQRWFAELYQAQRESAQQLLDSSDERIDADTVALFLEELDLENQQMALGYVYVQEKHDEEAYTRSMEDLHQRLLNVQERLAERMGAYYVVREEDRENIAAYAEIPLSYSLYGEVAQSGLTVSIEELVSYQTQATLPAIAAYFCERQFSNVRYDLADQADMWMD